MTFFYCRFICILLLESKPSQMNIGSWQLQNTLPKELAGSDCNSQRLPVWAIAFSIASDAIAVSIAANDLAFDANNLA